jgi:hypothetical protein
MGTLRYDTPYWQLSVYMALIGIGLGMTMQNLVLAVQNTVGAHELGAASSVVAFFRSLGGAIGVSVLGAILGHKVKDYIADGLAGLGIPAGGSASGGTLPNVHTLPAPIRAVVESAYGHGAADIFLAAAPFGLIALIAVCFIKEVPLRRHNNDPLTDEVERESTVAAGGGASVVRTGLQD